MPGSVRALKLTAFSSTCAELQSITFKDCLIVDLTTTSRYHPDFLRFPGLTKLSLLRTSLDAGTTALFLSPGSFPNLRSLSISHCDLIEDANSRMRLGPLEPKSLMASVPQLALDGLSVDELGALEWDRFGKMEQLSVPMRALEGVRFDSLPGLSHLRLVDHPSTRWLLSPNSQDTLAPHLAAAKSLLALIAPDFPLESLGRTLEYVTVPTEWRDRVECSEPGQMKRTLERLGKACRKERVKIRFDQRKDRRNNGWNVAQADGQEGQFWEPEVCLW